MKSKCFKLPVSVLFVLFLAGSAPIAEASTIVFEELVSITEDGFSVAWDTDEAETTVLYYGVDPAALQPFALSEEPTKHHLVSISGLEEDTLYYYSTTDQIVDESAFKSFSPGQVWTLATPPGAFLFSFAAITDTHVGEEVAGLIAVGDISLTPGFSWDDPDNPYWLFTNREAVRAINEAGVDFVIHKGDVTAEAEEGQYEQALEIFGALDAEIHYVRGNHDRVRGENDFFKSVLGIDETHSFFDESGVRFVLMDTSDPDGLDAQIEWLGDIMLDAFILDLRVMIFAHQTFATKGALFWAIDSADADAIGAILSGYPKFSGMFAGHSHRAKVNFEDATGFAPYVETPPTKEYPMGYNVVHVYEGGYTQSFFRTACAECLEWASITRGEYFGFAPWIMLGTAEDRNFTILYPDYHGDDDTVGDDASADDSTDDESDQKVSGGDGEIEEDCGVCG